MDKKYEIIIFWSSEDNAYVAEVPELAGCMADGRSLPGGSRQRGANYRGVDRNGNQTR